MNAVGIDVSKGESMVAAMRPFGEVVLSPYEVHHTDSELSNLAEKLKSLPGETRVVMEYTGNYHAPILYALNERGIIGIADAAAGALCMEKGKGPVKHANEAGKS